MLPLAPLSSLLLFSGTPNQWPGQQLSSVNLADLSQGLKGSHPVAAVMTGVLSRMAMHRKYTPQQNLSSMLCWLLCPFPMEYWCDEENERHDFLICHNIFKGSEKHTITLYLFGVVPEVMWNNFLPLIRDCQRAWPGLCCCIFRVLVNWRVFSIFSPEFEPLKEALDYFFSEVNSGNALNSGN